MKKIIFAAIILFVFVSCSSIRVTSDYDKTAPFSTYRTFSFTGEAINLPIDDLNRNRIIKAVEKELELKGFSKSDKPDVLVDIKLTAENIQTATAANTRGYGYGYRYGWGSGFSTTTINYDSYKEGTLFIDIIDASKKQLVWQGRGVGTINDNLSSEKREAGINNAVKLIFEKYPPLMK
jgi:hypothetical protein